MRDSFRHFLIFGALPLLTTACATNHPATQTPTLESRKSGEWRRCRRAVSPDWVEDSGHIALAAATRHPGTEKLFRF
jgi:hypothetical protein